MNNLDIFDTRVLASRHIANVVMGYESADNELAWHVLDDVIPYIEFLEAQVSKLAYTLEVINDQQDK